jgi:hypothetical protein
MLRVAVLAPVLAGLALLAGCSSGTNPVPEKTKTVTETKTEPVLYTAKECFSRLEGQARLWASDAMPFHVESDFTPESTGKDGKTAVWRAIFVSGSRRTAKAFTCSGSRAPDAPVFGVTADMEMPYDPKYVPFDSFLLKVNSDKAFEVAQQHGGENLLKKDPQQPVAYLVEMARGQTVPHWYVIYGKNLKDNKGIGVINATTGAFLRASK